MREREASQGEHQTAIDAIRDPRARPLALELVDIARAGQVVALRYRVPRFG